MIVKCEQCQTRFKIPDEKVTDKGVKVRCTKCGHTFRVTRESAASASGAPVPGPAAPGVGSSDAGFDPFEAFGRAPEPPKGTHTTRPGAYPEGVEASRAAAAPPPPAPWNAPDSGVHDEVYQETTRVIPLQVPPEARPPVPSLPPLPFDFGPGTAAPRQTTPAPGQGLPGPGAVSFRPGAAGSAPLPGVPSVAPSVPAGARSLPTPPPVKPGSAGLKPLGGTAPAAPRTLAPPAMPPPGPAAPASSARPGGKPSAPAPAAAPGAPDLFTEFFAGPAGGSAPAAPLPDFPEPGLPPVAAFPAPAQARPAAPVPSFEVPDADPFGAVSGDLGDVPADPGPAPEFDPMAMFEDPAPAPVPVAPPMSSAAGRLTPLPAPSFSTSPAMGRPHPMPPTGAPPTGLGRPPAVALTPAPRMAPPAMPPPPAAAPAPAPVSSASFADEDPFGASNVDLSDSPADFGFEAPPAAAPAQAPSAAPMAFADDDPFGPGALGLGSAADEPAVTAPDHFAAPAPMPAAPSADEFGPSFGGGMPQQQASPALPDGFTPPSNMDFGMLGDEQMPTDSQPMMDPGGMSDPFGAPAAGEGMADPFGGPAPGGGMDDPFAAQSAPGGIPDPFAAQADGGGNPDPFAAHAGGGIPDPFASAEPAFSPTTTGRQMIGSPEGFLTQTDTSHQVISPTETGRQLLDLPAHPGTEMEQGGEGEFSAAGSRELIDLPTQSEAPPPAAKPAPSLGAAAIARPAGRPADMGIPERRKQTTAQAVTGQVAYLTIAAGLLLALTAVGGVYMKEGRVDPSALSPAHLMKLLTPSQFAARGVANGLYDTRGGTPVFYVRGEAENRSGKPVRVKVLAALYDGDQRVKSAEGLAGMLPTPEELHALTNPEAVAQLRSKLDASAAVIPPGGKVPFAVVFQEYPQELSAFRLQVTMEPAPEEGSPQ